MTTTTYRIVAKGRNVEQTIEILGDAHGRTYGTRTEAEAAAAELREDAPGLGFADVEYVVVEAGK